MNNPLYPVFLGAYLACIGKKGILWPLKVLITGLVKWPSRQNTCPTTWVPSLEEPAVEGERWRTLGPECLQFPLLHSDSFCHWADFLRDHLCCSFRLQVCFFGDRKFSLRKFWKIQFDYELFVCTGCRRMALVGAVPCTRKREGRVHPHLNTSFLLPSHIFVVLCSQSLKSFTDY